VLVKSGALLTVTYKTCSSQRTPMSVFGRTDKARRRRHCTNPHESAAHARAICSSSRSGRTRDGCASAAHALNSSGERVEHDRTALPGLARRSGFLLSRVHARRCGLYCGLPYFPGQHRCSRTHGASREGRSDAAAGQQSSATADRLFSHGLRYGKREVHTLA
jgi:hypothetical protein